MPFINYKPVITLAFLLMSFCAVKSQSNDKINGLSQNISNSLKNTSSTLFVHFDKTIYTNNDNAWFTAYLLKANPSLQYHTVAVSLVNDLDKSVVMENRFVMSNGLAFGKATIPDVVAPGRYTFFVVTDVLRNNKPDVVFTQPILIRSAELQEITAAIEPVDTSATSPQQKVRLNVQPKSNSTNTKDKQPEVQLNYYVGSVSHPVFKGFGKTKSGVYDLSLPSAKLTEGNNMLHMQLWYNSKIMELSFNLPAKRAMPLVNFYPEGGQLVEGMENNIAWEVKTQAGQPVVATGFLMKDGKVVDTISTRGTGSFRLLPVKGSKYSLKLYRQADSTYNLPVAYSGRPMLTLQRALINDTLMVNIRATQHGKYQLIAHNNDQLFFIKPLDVAPGIKKLSFLLKNIPKGVCQLLLTDSSGAQVIAERLFFAHYYDQPVISINTDKGTYHTREKVSVQLKLTGADTAEVSIAAVQASRVKEGPFTNIRNYLYLTNELADIPLNLLDAANTNDQLMETLLLTSKWKTLNWKSILSTPIPETPVNYSYISFKGRVSYLDKPLEKPVSLINVTNPNVYFNTDADGKFTLSNELLKTGNDTTVNFVVADDKTTDYTINMVDPYAILMERLAGSVEVSDGFDAPSATNYLYVPDNEHAIKLKEVNIKGKKDDAFYNASNMGGQAVEYVPVQKASFGADGKITKYTEVSIIPAQRQNYVLQLKAIQQINSREKALFSATSSEQQYYTTLFWNHHKIITPTQNAGLSFYTGDITGSFKVIVQGRTPLGVVYGEASFDVKK